MREHRFKSYHDYLAVKRQRYDKVIQLVENPASTREDILKVDLPPLVEMDPVLAKKIGNQPFIVCSE